MRKLSLILVVFSTRSSSPASNSISKKHAWLTIIMHMLYNPRVSPLPPAHPSPLLLLTNPPLFTPPPHVSSSLPLQELKLPVYRAHSPQIGMRRYFADLLAILSNRYQLCPTARHLAVYLLDLFMDHYDVAVKQLYVIALSCLLLASKSIKVLSPQLTQLLPACLVYYIGSAV